MTALATEIRGIHVGDAAITRRAYNDKVDKSGRDDDFNPAAEEWVLEADLGIDGRYLTDGLEVVVALPDADRNKNEPEYKQARQK